MLPKELCLTHAPTQQGVPTKPGRARDALRAATRDAHEAVDATFGGFDLTEKGGYARFLRAHARVVPALEAWLDDHQPDALAGWQAVRRGPALIADLAALGESAPDPVPLNLPADIASVCGATYVLEGSRLGGAFLSRSVPDGLPKGYLGAPPQSALWRDFAAQLDALLPDEAATDRAGETALAIFALFRSAATATPA